MFRDQAAFFKSCDTAAIALTIALSTVGVTAQAGGIAPPAPAPVVVVPAPAAPAQLFEGFYAGGSFSTLSTNFDKNCAPDMMEYACEDWALEEFENYYGGDDALLWGMRVGYDWRRGMLVYGILGEYETGADEASGVDSLMALKARLGYLLGNSDLLYGAIGAAQATTVLHADAVSDDANRQPTASGLVAGFGYEHYITSALTLYGEFNHYDLGTITHTDPYLDGVAHDIKMSGIKFGINFRF